MDRRSTILEHEAFRNILEAVARPGRPRRVAASVATREAALDLLCDCVMDSESSLGFLDDRDGSLARRVALRTGCRLVPASEADFVLAGAEGAGARIAGLRSGDPEYPDRGCTLVYLVQELGPEGGRWEWTGPGIPDRIRPSFAGLPDSEWPHLRSANSVYPLGVDSLFLDRSGRILALPRSTRIEEAS